MIYCITHTSQKQWLGDDFDVNIKRSEICRYVAHFRNNMDDAEHRVMDFNPIIHGGTFFLITLRE